MKVSPQPNNVDLIFLRRGIGLTTSGDQFLNVSAMNHLGGSTLPFEKFIITDIRFVCTAGAADAAPVGGIYNAASKGGSAVVAAAQSWAGASAVGKIVTPTLAAVCATDVQTLAIGASALFFNLTTLSGTSCTGDLYVFGIVLY
jgi:hypothetical protein